MHVVHIHYTIPSANKAELRRNVQTFVEAQARLVPEARYTSYAVSDTEYVHIAEFPTKELGERFKATAAFERFSSFVRTITSPEAKPVEVVASTSREVLDLVLAYNAAWVAKDLAKARGYLADDLRFRGSIDKFDRADDFIAGLGQFVNGPYLGAQEILASTASGDRVHLLYTAKTPWGDLRFSESFRVAAGRIAAIDLVFDPTPFKG